MKKNDDSNFFERVFAVAEHFDLVKTFEYFQEKMEIKDIKCISTAKFDFKKWYKSNRESYIQIKNIIPQEISRRDILLYADGVFNGIKNRVDRLIKDNNKTSKEVIQILSSTSIAAYWEAMKYNLQNEITLSSNFSWSIKSVNRQYLAVPYPFLVMTSKLEASLFPEFKIRMDFFLRFSEVIQQQLEIYKLSLQSERYLEWQSEHRNLEVSELVLAFRLCKNFKLQDPSNDRLLKETIKDLFHIQEINWGAKEAQIRELKPENRGKFLRELIKGLQNLQ